MAPTAPALPAGSTLGHSFEYGLDINFGTAVSPNWKRFRRISDLQPAVTPVTQDAATYDDFGSPNVDKVGESWVVTFAALVNRSTSTGLFTEEIEKILAATKPAAKGEAAVLHVRYYHKPEAGTPNPTDAYEGYATVGVARANTGADGSVEKWTITLTGKGPRKEITNPFTGWDATAPVISSALPAEAGTGDLITLTGSSFTGTSAVTIGGEAADFTVVSDATLVVVLPADDAGSAPIIVTTSVGASTPFAYTRAA